MTEYTKRDVLQSLLDTSKLCTDLFDEVEADTFRPNQVNIGRVGTLARALTALHEQMILEYALSGDASRDMLRGVQDQFRDPRRR